jgi:hypothetical protein
MKRNKFLDFVEEHQAFALGWIFITIMLRLIDNRDITSFLGLIFVTLLIINLFYQIKLKYNERR